MRVNYCVEIGVSGQSMYMLWKDWVMDLESGGANLEDAPDAKPSFSPGNKLHRITYGIPSFSPLTSSPLLTGLTFRFTCIKVGKLRRGYVWFFFLSQSLLTNTDICLEIDRDASSARGDNIVDVRNVTS
jgi:hypothetical protein